MLAIDYKQLRVFSVGLVVGALILLVVALPDISRTPYLGYRVSSSYTVTQVDAHSPAAEAGLRKGDHIAAIGNLSTEKLFQLSRQPRTEIGQEQKLAIVRDLGWQELVLKATALPRKGQVLAWSGNLLAVLLLALGCTVFWKRPAKPAFLFFLSNLCFALALMTPPYMESFVLRQMVALNFLIFVTMGLAFFLHLSVVFPKEKPPVAETPVELLIYFPVPVMAVFFLSLRLFQPWADLRLNQFLHYAFGLAVVYCLGLALAAIIHSRWTAGAEFPRGFGMVLAASLIGAIPPALGVLFDAFFPQVRLAGREFYPLMVVVVSLAFAWALSRSHRPKPKVFRHAA